MSSTGAYLTTLGHRRSLSQCNLAPRGESLMPLSTKPSLPAELAMDGFLHVAGVQFSVRTAGYVTGIRYVEPGEDERPHAAKIWDSSGRLLYQQQLKMDSCGSGEWVNVTFDSPVYLPVATGYVASIDNLYGWAATPSGFRSASSTGGSLSLDISTAGRFARALGLTAGMPGPAGSTNYWIDVDFTPGSSAPVPVPGPSFLSPYAGAFGGDGNFYVGLGQPEPSANSTCGTWPGSGYQTLFTSNEVPVSRDSGDGLPYAVAVRFTTAVRAA